MEKTKQSFRKGGEKKTRKEGSARVVVTSVYVGDKPMEDVIGNAVIDIYKRKTVTENVSA